LLLNDMLNGRMLVQTFQNLIWEDQSLNSTHEKLITLYGNTGDDLGNTVGLVTQREDQSDSSVSPFLRVAGHFQAGSFGSTNTITKKRAAYQAHSSNTTYIPVIQGNQSPATEPLSMLYVRVSPFSLVLAIGCRWNDDTGLWENLNLNVGTYVPMKIEFGTVAGASGSSIRGFRVWRRVTNVATWDDGITNTGWQAFGGGGGGPTFEESLLAFALEVSTTFTDLQSKIPAFSLGGYLSGLASLSAPNAQQAEVIPRLQTVNNLIFTPYGLVGEFDSQFAGPTVDRVTRLYVGSTGFTITYNAHWDPSTSLWVSDNGASTIKSIRMDIGPTGVTIRAQDASLSSWADATWGADPEAGKLLLQSNLLSSSAAAANSLYSKNIVKAWGLVHATTTTPTLLDGFGVSAVSYNGDNLHVTLSVANTPASDYAALANFSNQLATGTAYGFPVSSTAFEVIAYDLTHTQENLNGSGDYLVFIVMNTQS
jgi:hypothetical protein